MKLRSVVGWLSLVCLAQASDPVLARPNVLLIIADDLNTALGAYGDPLAQTPNLDRLAARGVRFAQAHCQYPLCNPSRASFLTGRRPEHLGLYSLDVGPAQAAPETVRLPQFFRTQGYFTAGAGKVYHNLRTNDDASWDAYEDGRPTDPQEQAALDFRQGGSGTPSWHELDGDGAETRDGRNARTIARHVREQAEARRPFFLALGLHKPHLPWTAPRRHFERHDVRRFQLPEEPRLEAVPEIALQTELSGFPGPADVAAARRAYYACVSFIDEQIGLVLDELDRLDLWRNTIVVFTSDNGFHLGDHGGLWAKFSAFAASTRVPLLLAGPGVPAGQVVTSPVELLDLFPTLAESAGLPPPPGLEGVSLLRAIAGEPREAARSLVFHLELSSRRNIAGRTLITQDWRYTRWDEGLGEELYLHADDPDQYRNRATAPGHGEIVARARSMLGNTESPRPGKITSPRALSPASAKQPTAKPAREGKPKREAGPP